MTRLALLLLLAVGCSCFLTRSEKAEICKSGTTSEKCLWIDDYMSGGRMPLRAVATISKPSTAFCYEGFETNSLPALTHAWQGVEVTVKADPSNHLKLVVSNTSQGVFGDASSTVNSQAAKSFNVSSIPYFNPYRLVCFGVKRVGSGGDVDFAITARLVFLQRFPVLMAIGLFLLFNAHQLSRNVTLFYGSGVTIGVVASLLILLYVFSKFVPKKNILGLGVLIGGYTLAASFSYWLFSNLMEVVTDNWQYVLGYVIISGLISFGVLYRMGPVSNSRTFDLIQWCMQGVGILCLYMSSQTPEVGVASVVLALVFYWVPIRYNPVLFVLSLVQAIVSYVLTPFHSCLHCLSYLNPLNWFVWSPERRLLTMEEYDEQGRVETEKALADLRDHCKDKTEWSTISKLKDPKRFTEFLSGRDHVTELERVEHEWSLDDSSDADSAEYDDDDITNTSSPHVSSFESSPRSTSSRYLSDDSSHSSPNHAHHSRPHPHSYTYTNTRPSHHSSPYAPSPRQRNTGRSHNY